MKKISPYGGTHQPRKKALDNGTNECYHQATTAARMSANSRQAAKAGKENSHDKQRDHL